MARNDVEMGAELLNVQDVFSLIKDLGAIDRSKAVRDGLRRGAGTFVIAGRRKLRKRMKAGAKGFTGNLTGSFIVRVKRDNRGALAGFRRTHNASENQGWHSHLVDQGTTQRSTKKGKNRGSMPANFFWTDTRNQEGRNAIDTVMRGIEAACERIRARRN